MGLTVACVRTGTKYSIEYVQRLQKAVGRHLPIEHDFVCFTDRECSGLPGWWGKMALFEPTWRAGQRVLYFDLDTVIVGDLSPLARLDVPFAICDNFTRLAGHSEWPCKYGSCAMTIGPEFDGDLWDWFIENPQRITAKCGRYGDQKAIEMWSSKFPLLQRLLPPGFFVGYRDLPRYPDRPPEGASLVVFAGENKPHKTNCEWAKRAWAA